MEEAVKYPSEAMIAAAQFQDSIERGGSGALMDPKMVDDLVQYVDWASARIPELEQQRSELMFKIRCVAQALK